MKFREHRGSLAASMDTVIEFHSRADLARHIANIWPESVTNGAVIEAKPYCAEDPRIGWRNIHIITAEPGGVIGFIDGPLPKPTPFE